MIGRGRLPGAVIPREESSAPQVSPTPTPTPPVQQPTPPQPQTVSQVQTQLTRMTLVEEIPDSSRRPQTTSSPTVVTTAPTAVSKRSDGGDGQTVLTSTATGTGRGGGGAGGAGSSGGVTRQSGGSASLQKAEDELRVVEEIKRKSPVQKMGVDGVTAQFVTNYMKLKCCNKGVYQYFVQFNPPIDSKYHRVKLVYFLSELIGNVRLFDGYTLFLPILLKDKVSSGSTYSKHTYIQTYIILITYIFLLGAAYILFCHSRYYQYGLCLFYICVCLLARTDTFF